MFAAAAATVSAPIVAGRRCLAPRAMRERSQPHLHKSMCNRSLRECVGRVRFRRSAAIASVHCFTGAADARASTVVIAAARSLRLCPPLRETRISIEQCWNKGARRDERRSRGLRFPFGPRIAIHNRSPPRMNPRFIRFHARRFVIDDASRRRRTMSFAKDVAMSEATIIAPASRLQKKQMI